MRKVGIKDIAKLTGVSIATVSYVINNKENQSISQETRKKVLDAAKELNYHSNSAAVSLRKGSVDIIGVVLNKRLEYLRFAELVQVLRTIFGEMNKSILLISDKNEENPKYLSFYYKQIIDGMIFIDSNDMGLSEEILNQIKKERIPFVAVNCSIKDKEISSVEVDYEYSVKNAIDILIREKAKKIHFIYPSVNSMQEHIRLQTFLNYTKEKAVDFEVHELKFNSSTIGKYDRGEKIKENELNLIKSTNIEQVCKKMSNLPEDDAIICPWSNLLKIFLFNDEYKVEHNTIITLDDDSSRYKYKGKIFRAKIPNLKTGEVAAQILTKLLENKEAIAKEIIKPDDIKSVDC